MMQRLINYLSALLVLMTLAVVYNAFMEQWLKPPKVASVPLREPTELEADDTLGDLFPDRAWQRGRCKRIATADGMLLFENWEQINEDQWKLWPITVVVGRGISGEGEVDPVVLNADEGAEVRFAESFDVMSGGRAPPIQRGRMMGLVEIRRNSSEPKRKPLLIRTTDVGIDSRKVWTTQPIHARMGDVKMVGRDLTLHLAASAGSRTDGQGASAILDRMELIYLDELVVPLEKGALWEAKNQKPNLKKPGMPTRIGTLDTPLLSMTCNGRVQYDFAINQLSLSESVQLIQDVPGVARDKFSCEALELRFREPENRRIEREGPLDWLDHIRASGEPVLADLPSLDCRIAANEISFDAIRGVLHADGSTGVQVQRGAMKASLTQLNYVYNPKSPKALGTIDNWGPGIVQFADPDVPLRQVQWKERVQFWPQGKVEVGAIDNDLVVRLTGEVHAVLTDGGEFKTDAVECVLKPSMQAAKNGKKAKQTLVPDRFEATGDVQIDTSAVAAKTKRLVLFFVEQYFKPQTPAGTGPKPPTESSLRRWVTSPNQQPTMKDPVARKPPVIKGDLITAKLSLSEGNIVASDLSVRGGVKLNHSVNAGGQMLPAELTGTELRLRDGGGKDVLYLGSRSGQPSKLKLGDGYFQGPLIRVWPNDNVVRIEGAGEFSMPTAVLPKTLTGSDPNRIRWTKPPFCKWNGEMVFDGKTASLTEGVDITANLIDRNQPMSVHMTGDRLELMLLENVQVGQFQSMRSAAIQQVTLLQTTQTPVTVVCEQFGIDNVLESRHVLHAPRLTLLPSGNGKLIGAGPGSYRSWMYSDTKGVLAGNKEKTKDGEKSLMGLHLVYQDSMQGDMLNRTLAFLRGVRVGAKTVESWREEVDADRMNSISLGDSTVDCDALQIAIEHQPNNMPKIAGLPTPWEMQANGGVVFRTRRESGLLEGTAARAVYSAKKDLFTVVGAPNRGAIIKKTNTNGQPGPQITVREMTIRAETLEIENMILEQATLGTLPNNSNR